MSIDNIAQRYGVLPSKVIEDTLDDFTFNRLVAARAMKAEIDAAKKAKRGG